MPTASHPAHLVSGLRCIALGSLAGFVILVALGTHLADSAVGHALYVLVYVLAAALLGLRAAGGGPERTAWAVSAAAQAICGLGWASYFLVVQRLSPVPYPSISDFLWITSYLCNGVTLILLAASTLRVIVRRVWVDGLIVALALAALSAAFLVEPIVASTGASLPAVLTNLAYPVLDLLLVAIVLIVFASTNWRPSRRWLSLGAIFGAQAVADAIYLRQTATGHYQPGTLLDSSWLVAVLALAWVAWRPGRPDRGSDPRSGDLVAAPMAAAVVALGLLAKGELGGHLGGVAAVLAMVTLLVAILRAGTGYAAAQTLTRTRELTRRTELILESAGEGIYGLDAAGLIVFANAAACSLTGHSPEDLQGQPAHGLLHHSRVDGRPYPVAECPVCATLADGERHHAADEVCWRRDGSSFAAEFTSTPISRSGGIQGAVVVFRDVTERREIDRMKDEFTAVVSHELRTPLTSIRGSLGLVAGGALGELPPRAQRMVDIAVSNTDRLVRLINDILDIERIESGRVSMDPQVCRAGDLVIEALDMARPLAQAAGVELTSAIADVALSADGNRLVQTLTNLVGNAVKFSSPGSVVHVACARSGPREVTFRVTDQGRGIPQAKLETIFERFQQVDASDAREKGGTGLGLSISRSIVEQHGGRIWVESRVGEGSTFLVSLPADAEPSASPAGEPPRRPSVLVCDDDELILEAAGAILRRAGFEPLLATSGELALKLAVAERPDVILLDLLMPGLSGWQTADALRARPETAATPIIVLSVLGVADAEAPEGGVVEWLEKPLEEGSLLRALARAIEAPHETPRVLVVEDDAGLGEVLTATFERHGLDTLLAPTAAQALELIRTTTPDLMVLDLGLPDADGFTVLRELRARRAGIPVVVYTGRDLDESTRAQLNDGGSTEVMTKAVITPEVFETRVLELIGQLTKAQA